MDRFRDSFSLDRFRTIKMENFYCYRVSEIQTLTEDCQWGHVRTHNNPADLITRGAEPEILISSPMWWHGPNEITYTKLITKPNYNDDLVKREMTTKVIVSALAINDDKLNLLNRYSCLNKLQNVTAYILRFCSNMKSKNRLLGKLSNNEINNAMKNLIKLTQNMYFSDEIKQLRSSNNCIQQADCPFLDDDESLQNSKN